MVHVSFDMDHNITKTCFRSLILTCIAVASFVSFSCLVAKHLTGRVVRALDLDHEFPGLNPVGGGYQVMNVQHLIAQSLSLSPLCCLGMVQMMLKGTLTHSTLG